MVVVTVIAVVKLLILDVILTVIGRYVGRTVLKGRVVAQLGADMLLKFQS